MNGAPSHRVPHAAELAATAARWLLAAVFIYMGLSKALHPVEFLKLVREYGVFEQRPLLLNLVAAGLPWIEIVCGALLLLGVAVRGAAVLLLAMLVSFTALIVWRALGVHEASGLPFCGIHFDCGCGAGEILVCRKLAENAALALLSGILVFTSRSRFCLRHTLLARAGPKPAEA